MGDLGFLDRYYIDVCIDMVNKDGVKYFINFGCCKW